MKNQPAKKKAKKEDLELKTTLCDIINTLNKFAKTNKKLEELANFCSGGQNVKTEANR